MTSITTDDAEIITAAGIIGALDSPLRLRIIDLLGRRDHYVHEIVSIVGKSQPLVSQHLKVLKESGLVSAARCGRQVGYHLAVPEVLSLLTLVVQLKAIADDRALNAERYPAGSTMATAASVGNLDVYRSQVTNAQPEDLPQADKLAGAAAAAVRFTTHPTSQTPMFGA